MQGTDNTRAGPLGTSTSVASMSPHSVALRKSLSLAQSQLLHLPRRKNNNVLSEGFSSQVNNNAEAWHLLPLCVHARVCVGGGSHDKG